MVTINRNKAPGGIAPWKSDRRLYVDYAKTRLVDESEAGGKVLLVGAGGLVSDADCKKYGLGRYEGKVAPYSKPKAAPEETPSQEIARLQAETEALEQAKAENEKDLPA